MYALDALESMEKGEILLVIADCPQSFKSVPEEAIRHGYKLLQEPQKINQDIYFYLAV